MPILSMVLWLPIVAAIVLAFFPRAADSAIKAFGLFASVVTFIVSLFIVTEFRSGAAGFQLVEMKAWIPQWGINYALGIDGISLWLVMLTTLLTPVVLLSSWNAIHKHPKEYVISFLVMEAAMIGVFVATDLILFYVFFELTLIPMYLVIGVWGGANRIYAAIKFFLFTIAGSLLMLFGIIYIGFQYQHATGVLSFAITDLYRVGVTPYAQTLLFFAFSLAFAIKVPLFPLHTWLPDAHVEAPTGGSIILAGVMLKMGTYGLLRFAFPLFPGAAADFAQWLGWLAVVGIVYGALVAMVQPDMKKLVAYSSVSHMGFVVLGLSAMTIQGVQGSVFQMLSHGVSTGGLFMIVGMLSDRRHTRLISEYGGIKAPMPRLVAAFLVITLASIALPGTNGFIGEFLILLGAFGWDPWMTAVAATGVILSAVYMLWMFQRVNYGPITNEKNRLLPDLTPREWAMVVPTVAACILMGVLPGMFLGPMELSVNRLIDRVKARQSVIVRVVPIPAPTTAPYSEPGTVR